MSSRRSLSVAALVTLLLGALLARPLPSRSQAEPIVYVVIAIDTENGNICWYPTQACRNDPNPLFDTHHYKTNDLEASTIFSQAYRDAHLDSFGGSFKMSWFAEMDQQFEAATYLDESPAFPGLTGQPAGYTGIMDTLQRYWGDEIEQFGDGIYWHHHVQAWTGSAWEMDAAVISGYTHHYDALNAMVLDRSYYPSVYRAGWLWEDSNINTFLNEWIPFDYSASSGTWAPYQPNTINPWSSTSPNLERWMTRTDNLANQTSANTAFAQAAANGASLYSIYFHDREDMPGFIDTLQSVLENAATSYPGVQFRYVAALDGIQSVLGFADRVRPTLIVSQLDGTTYQITSDETLWQDTPYVAARYANADGHYNQRVEAVSTGINTWQATFPPQVTITPDPPTPVQLTPLAVTASGEHTAAGGAATNAVDGNLTTYWDSAIDLVEGGHGGQFPAWIQLELEDVETITSMDIHFYDNDSRTYTYGVEASSDGATWTPIVPAGTVVHGLATHPLIPPLELRFVRITVTDNSVVNNDWAHIKEIRLYGVSSLVEVNPVGATASSENPAFPGYPASNAIDRNETTWWDSGYVVNDVYYGQVPAWLQTDLGEVRDIELFSIHFYDNDTRSYTYNVEASVDGATWNEVVASTSGQGVVIHELAAPLTMRYLRITVTGGTAVNPHGTFAHIKEVRFFAEGELPEAETFFLEKVAAGASDLSGNPNTAEYILDPTAVTLASFRVGAYLNQVRLVLLALVPCAGLVLLAGRRRSRRHSCQQSTR